MKAILCAIVLMASFSIASEKPDVHTEKHPDTKGSASKVLHTPTRIGNNLWQMHFLMGNGFNFNTEELQDHRVYDQFESTYDINVSYNFNSNGKFASSRAEYADELDIGGYLSVEYGPVSGSGSLHYNEQTSSQEQNVFYWQEYVQQCGCISFDYRAKSDQLMEDVGAQLEPNEMRTKYGDFYVSSVCFGATFKLEFTFSTKSSSEVTTLEGSLHGDITNGMLHVIVDVSGSGSTSSSESSISSEMHSEVNGFDLPCAVSVPTDTASANALYDCIGKITTTLQESCNGWKGGSGKTMEEVLAMKKGLFPISVTVTPIANIHPFDFPNDKFDKMNKNIKTAWKYVRLLNDYLKQINFMMDSFTTGVLAELADIDTDIGSWVKFGKYTTVYSEITKHVGDWLGKLLKYVGGEAIDFDFLVEHPPDEIYNENDTLVMIMMNFGKLADGIHEKSYSNFVFRGIFVYGEESESKEPFFGSIHYNGGETIISKVLFNDLNMLEYAAQCGIGIYCFLVNKEGASPSDMNFDILKEGDICIQSDGKINTVLKITPWAKQLLLDDNSMYPGYYCQKGEPEVEVGETEGASEVAVGSSMKVLRTPTKIENNIWQMTWLLGSGFSFNNEQIQDHRVYDHQKSTYVIEAHKSQSATGKFASSVSEYSSQLELGGKISVTYGPISGSGSMSYNSKTSTQQQHVFYTQEYTQICGCISFQNKVFSETLEKDSKSNLDMDKMRELYGDYYIDNVCYGSNFKLEFTFTTSSSEESTSIEGELEGKVGIAGLTVAASVNAKYATSSSESSTSSEIHHEANGFVVPCTIANPIEGSNYDAAKLQKCVEEIGVKLSQSCVNFDSHWNQSLDDVLTKKGGLFPIHVQVVPIADITPFNFPVGKYQIMKNHIDAAWDDVRFLRDFIDTIQLMKETFYTKVIQEIMDVDTFIEKWKIYNLYKDQYQDAFTKATNFLAKLTDYIENSSFNDFFATAPSSFFSAADRMALKNKGKMIDGVHEKYYSTALFRGIFVYIDDKPSPFYGSLTYADGVVSKVMMNDHGHIAYAALCEGTNPNKQEGSAFQKLQKPLHNCFLVPKINGGLDEFDLDILSEHDKCYQTTGRNNEIVKIHDWANEVILNNRLRYPGSLCQKLPVGAEAVEVAVGSAMEIIKTQTSKPDGPYQAYFPLGFGFDFLTQEKMDSRIFASNTTYIIEEHSSQTGVGRYASSISEYSSQLEVGGKLSVSFGPISGEGSLSYNEQTSTQQQNVFYYQQYTQTCGCISLDQTWLHQELLDAIADKNIDLKDLRKQYGDYYIANVCYGSTFKIEFTFTSQSQTDILDLEGKLKGKVGWGPLSVSAEVNIAKHESSSTSSMSSTLETEANGFSIPDGCALENPKSLEEAEVLKDCVEIIVEALSNSCNEMKSGTGKSKDEVLSQKDGLFATAITVLPITHIEPFSFPIKKYEQLKKHIDLAWSHLRYVNDIRTTLETMMGLFSEKVIRKIADVDTDITSWNKYQSYRVNYNNAISLANMYDDYLNEYLKKDLDYIWNNLPPVDIDALIDLQSSAKLIDGIHEKGYGTSVFRGIFIDDDAVFNGEPFYGTLTFAFDIVSRVVLDDDGIITFSSLCGNGENDQEPHNCFLVGKGEDQKMIDQLDLDILRATDECIKEDGDRAQIQEIKEWSHMVILNDGSNYPGRLCKKDGCPSGFIQSGSGNINNKINHYHRIGNILTVDDYPDLVMIKGCSTLCENNDKCFAFTYDEYEQKCTLGTSLMPDGNQGTNTRFCRNVPLQCNDYECGPGWMRNQWAGDIDCPDAICSNEVCCYKTNTCDSMECPSHMRKKENAHEITCDRHYCSKDECCDMCQTRSTDQCAFAYKFYLFECFGEQEGPFPYSYSKDYIASMDESCLYCDRWDDIDKGAFFGYINALGWDGMLPRDFDIRKECGVHCGSCMPEEEKCYDSDIIGTDGINGDNEKYSCSDYRLQEERCDEASQHANGLTNAEEDCCACGGGRIGPKCPKEFPYWGVDEFKYGKSYICWATENGVIDHHDCSSFCIGERNKNLDSLQGNYLKNCQNSICQYESKTYDCSKMTATVIERSGKDGESEVHGYSDHSGKRCIFESVAGDWRRMVAIYPESCTISTMGWLSKSNNEDSACYKSKKTSCWGHDWKQFWRVTLSKMGECKPAIHQCPLSKNNQCGPQHGYCKNFKYCNEDGGWCGDSDAHKVHSTGKYDHSTYLNCLRGEGYSAEETSISYYKTVNGQYCEPSLDITTIPDCKKAANALGLKWGSGYTMPGDWRACSYTDDGRNEVYFNEAENPSEKPNKTNYAALCQLNKCVPYTKEACAAAAQKAGMRLGTDERPFLNPFGEDDVKGCYVYPKFEDGKHQYQNVAFYSSYGTLVDKKSILNSDMYRPHGHDCYRTCPEECYECLPKDYVEPDTPYVFQEYNAHFMCTNYCQENVCSKDVQYRMGGVDCTQCTPLVSMRDFDYFMVAAENEEPTNGLPYGKMIVFAALAFGVGYGYSKYAGRHSKYLPLVSKN